jgi:hypothetical protein
MCKCEFDPYPIEDEDFGEESLHCPHDGYQNPCPKCGKRPVIVIE